MKLENKVAIITGSTRGIGRATAELFAKEGAKVVVVGTKEELGKEVAEEIKATGGEAIFCKTDVTSDESLENLVKTTLDAFGKIDILVNNAGVGGTTANMNQITMDEWNTVLAKSYSTVCPMQEGHSDHGRTGSRNDRQCSFYGFYSGRPWRTCLYICKTWSSGTYTSDVTGSWTYRCAHQCSASWTDRNRNDRTCTCNSAASGNHENGNEPGKTPWRTD